MEEEPNKWPKHITVDKRIVKILSGSTYANFPSAIREIIINSYDADAENVWVDIDLRKEIITIRDDGKGMNENDFSFYLRIAGKSRKKDSELTRGKRKIIGQFGVGFLSALPFCEKYLIETKKKDSNEIVHATITSTEYFNEDFNAIGVNEIPIFGGIKIDPSVRKEQFTRIRLVGFSKLAKSFFHGDYSIKSRRNTINNYPPLELFKWQLCEYLPIEYDKNDLIGSQLNSLFKSGSIIPFNVFLSKHRLYRNIHAKNILEISEDEQRIGKVRFKFAILTNYDPINPTEARYLMLRNLNVGVGERTTFELGLDGRVYAKLAHLTGEVNVIEGLNDLISVSRDKFNFSTEYEKLKDFLRQRLARWANELDTLQTLEKFVNKLEDTSRVTNIESLKKGRAKQDIGLLKSKGFNVVISSNRQDADIIKLDKESKEIILPKDFENYNKIIKVLHVEYKLILQKWETIDSDFPAVRIDKRIVYVNENYPLFHNGNLFDTFLKIHILLYEYLEGGKLNKKVYNSFINDFLTVFNG